LGKARSDDDSVIIKRSWIDAAIDAHLKIDTDLKGDKCLGYDVADSGSDNCATVLFDGSIALECQEWAASEDQLLESSTRVYHQAKANQAAIIYDSIGVGAGTGSHINQLNEKNYTNIEFSGFNAGAKVIDPDDIYLGEGSNAILNKDFFENAKAQAWWSLSVRFRNTYNAVHKGLKFESHQLISISSDVSNLQQLKDELSTPRKDYSDSGKVMVESKKKLAKRNIKSPNLADAFVMALAPKESESLDFLSSNVNFFN
jgi:phage terminase large subunit